MEIIEKEKVTEVPADYYADKYGYRRDVNGKANAGLTLGIIGTALGAWALFGNRRTGTGLGFASGLNGSGSTNINVNGVDPVTGMVSSAGPNAWEAWQKECQDTLALQKGLYDWALSQQSQRFADRQVINEEMFGIYKTTRDGFDVVNAKQNDIAFRLYKGSRDQYDDLSKQISDLKTHIAVSDAVRPYQDKMLQLEICAAKKDADFNDERIINYVNRLDCRNIKGINCLPNEPTVTGLPSNNPCYCPRETTPTTTPAQ